MRVYSSSQNSIELQPLVEGVEDGLGGDAGRVDDVDSGVGGDIDRVLRSPTMVVGEELLHHQIHVEEESTFAGEMDGKERRAESPQFYISEFDVSIGECVRQ